ncbi:hypothetical protein C8A03DRAFT_38888, partial [Achaetomium macrosporum]
MGDGDSKTRLFIPFMIGFIYPKFTYIAYDWVSVFAQRKINMLDELPDKPSRGFAELCNKVTGFAVDQDEQRQLGEDELTGILAINTEDQPVDEAAEVDDSA